MSDYRRVLSKPRRLEYFDKDALLTATGLSEEYFDRVIFKELVDNALDACESGDDPCVDIRVEQIDDEWVYEIADNGPGLSQEDMEAILDFEVYASSKAAYVGPTRGQLGNALMTIVGIPVAMNDGQEIVPLIVHTREIRYTVTVRVNHAIQDVRIELTKEPCSEPNTVFKVQAILEDVDVEVYAHMVKALSVFNPHVAFTFRSGDIVEHHI